MKKIIVDARLYGIEHTGIGRYVRGLVQHLSLPSNIKTVLLVANSHLHDPELKGFRLISTRFHPYSVLSQLEIALILKKEKPDLVHIPHFTIPLLWNGPTIVTIHDLIKHESTGSSTTTKPTYLYWIKFILYLFMVWVAVRKSAKIIVPSSYWKEKLVSKYKVDPEKIIFTYEGVDEVYFEKNLSKPTSVDLSKPFILYVGNLYPHKNVSTIVKAIKELNGKINLYISCARSVFLDRALSMVESLKASRNVFFLGFVEDEELARVHSQALAFVTASKIEGLGLPGLEAMAAGNPVISSNASCLPEIYGDAALYFDPNNHLELVEKINFFLKNPEKRKDFIEKGKLQVKKFTWKKMANQTSNIYLSLLNI